MAKADSAQPIALRKLSGRRVAAWLSAAVFAAAVMVMVGRLWPLSAEPTQASGADRPDAVAPGNSAVQSIPLAVELQPYQNLLANRSDDWRLTRLAENPKILVIEFPNLAAQGRALNRLAALIEKYGAPRDRVLSDEGLAKFIQQVGDTPETFYFGHDYPAEAVARFFTLSVSQQLMLNADELRLGNELLAAGLLKEESDKLVANPDRQAVVSFTAVQADDPRTSADETVDSRRREAILRHELSHGEFFTNAAYRQHCWTFWQQLSDSDRSLLRKFLSKLSYDPANEELMVNEAQAFLMHTPDRRAFDADQLGMSAERLANLRAKFNRGVPASIFSSIER